MVQSYLMWLTFSVVWTWTFSFFAKQQLFSESKNYLCKNHFYFLYYFTIYVKIIFIFDIIFKWFHDCYSIFFSSCCLYLCFVFSIMFWTIYSLPFLSCLELWDEVFPFLIFFKLLFLSLFPDNFYWNMKLFQYGVSGIL